MIRQQSKPAASFCGWQPHPSASFEERLRSSLMRWKGTPYQAGQQCAQGGVDCVRFVSAVLDEMTGKQTEIAKLPPDACFHKPELGYKAAAVIRSQYEPTVDVDTEKEPVQPGDVIITGPKHGGPGHAMIVGLQKGEVWHATNGSVHMTGLSAVFFMGHRVFYCYRLKVA